MGGRPVPVKRALSRRVSFFEVIGENIKNIEENQKFVFNGGSKEIQRAICGRCQVPLFADLWKDKPGQRSLLKIGKLSL